MFPYSIRIPENDDHITGLDNLKYFNLA